MHSEKVMFVTPKTIQAMEIAYESFISPPKMTLSEDIM